MLYLLNTKMLAMSFITSSVGQAVVKYTSFKKFTAIRLAVMVAKVTSFLYIVWLKS